MVGGGRQVTVAGQVSRVEDDGVGATAGAAAAVVQVEVGQILENLVQGLLLVLVGLAQTEHLVGAELADLVALEDVVLAHPVQLARRVVAYALHLRGKSRGMPCWIVASSRGFFFKSN